MAVDIIKLAPESFQTIYLRKEDRVILRTEQGRKIIIKRIFQMSGKLGKCTTKNYMIMKTKEKSF